MFFVNGARFFGQGNLLGGVATLMAFRAISELDAIGLEPHPSLVRVLLDTGNDD